VNKQQTKLVLTQALCYSESGLRYFSKSQQPAEAYRGRLNFELCTIT